MSKEKRSSSQATSNSSSVSGQYTKEDLFRRIQKYGVGHFLDSNSEVTSEERSIIQEILKGQSLDSYLHKIT